MPVELIIILVIFAAQKAFGLFLMYLNLGYLKKHGADVPAGFESFIDPETLAKSRNYLTERARFSAGSAVWNAGIALAFYFGGILNHVNSWSASWGWPLIPAAILFFLLLTVAGSLLDIPFDLYSVFKIEKKYGFNRMTGGLWAADFIKGILVNAVLLSILTAAGMGLTMILPSLWWLPVWIFYALFTLFIVYISPVVLEPLFNKFTPLEDEELAASIIELMARCGINISQVVKMDASKRSTHTNAYFSGIGDKKRIVLFDTLLEKLDREEILSVLAHEAGHWKKKHVLKTLVTSEIAALAVVIGGFFMIRSGVLTTWFGITAPTLPADVLLYGFVLGLAGFFAAPLAAWFSRRHEREADRFAHDLMGNSKGLVRALKKLTRDNLSNLYPHPLYAAWHYSHPPVIERVQSLEAMDK